MDRCIKKIYNLFDKNFLIEFFMKLDVSFWNCSFRLLQKKYLKVDWSLYSSINFFGSSNEKGKDYSCIGSGVILYACGGDCLKTQTSSVKIDTKLVKMALNMDLKDKKMTKKIVFRQSGGGVHLLR